MSRAVRTPTTPLCLGVYEPDGGIMASKSLIPGVIALLVVRECLWHVAKEHGLKEERRTRGQLMIEYEKDRRHLAVPDERSGDRALGTLCQRLFDSQEVCFWHRTRRDWSRVTPQHFTDSDSL